MPYDDEQFDKLYRQHNVRLIQFLDLRFRKLSAEDIASDTWMRAWKYKDQFREDSGFFTWLVRIAINRGMEIYRRNSVRPHEEIPESMNQFVCPAISADRLIINRQSFQRAMQMAGKHTAIIRMKLDGLTESEISNASGIPIGTVKVNIFRWKKRVKENV